MKYLNRAQRIAELEGVYELQNEPDLNKKMILIVDDITTTGTTLEVIAELIKGKYPRARVFGFVLAKTFDSDWTGITRNTEKAQAAYETLLKRNQFK